MEERRWSRASRWVGGECVHDGGGPVQALFGQRKSVLYVKGELLDAWA